MPKRSPAPGPFGARDLHRRLIGLYVQGSLWAVAVTFFLVLLGLGFTGPQWGWLALGTAPGVLLYVLPDIYLINRHYRPISAAVEKLDGGEPPDPSLVSRALVRALNLPIYSSLRVTLFHGPMAAAVVVGVLLTLNAAVDTGFETWQVSIFAAIVLLFASPTHAIFEFFAVSRAVTPTVERLWGYCDDLEEEDRENLISTNLRNKLLYLSTFVTALPLLFLSSSVVFKVHQLWGFSASAAMPLWVWVVGVSVVCVAGAFVMSLLTAVEVSRNASRLVDSMKRVEKGDLGVHLDVTGTDEYAELFRGFNLMTSGLREEVRILEVSHGLSAELNLDTLLERIMAATTELLGAERSTIFVHDPHTDELWSRLAEGIGEAGAIRIPADRGIAGRVFRTGEVLYVTDPRSHPDFNAEVDSKTGFRTRNILCMPITNKEGRRIGVTQVLNKRRGTFTAKDASRLQAFTAQVAVSLENAALFEDVVNMKNYNESILKSTSNGLITLDLEHRVVTANDAGLRLLDRERDAVSGAPAEEVFGDRATWVMRSLNKVEQSGQTDITVDRRLELPGRDTVWVNLTVLPLIDVNEERIGSMLILEDISGEKRVRTTMARYMSKEVADELLESGDAVLEGKDQRVTVLFADVRGFTTIAESLGARETVAMLNDYFTEMVDIISANGGILDKYIGDCIMSIFGAPFATPQDADNALRAANAMTAALRGLNERRAARGDAPISIGVGINTGSVVAGSIGSPQRMEYTVIGDSVNLASRLEGVNKLYGTAILLSEHTVADLKDGAKLRLVDRIRVKGKGEPVDIFEALGHHTEESFPRMQATLDAYNAGLVHYREREWAAARVAFESALSCNPGDGPSRVYAERCERFLGDPPSAEWDGVWDLLSK